ncbi:MAG: hypothetical protein ACXQTG_03635 [Methanoculleaceae archaeon]
MAGDLKFTLPSVILLLVITPVSASIQIIKPGGDAISSDRVKDIAWDGGDVVVFATDNGLSVYDGINQTWRIFHHNYAAAQTAGIMDDFIHAVSFDWQGRLWAGYGSGIQIANEGIEGTNWSVIRDQQLLKSLIINDIQRRGGEMWVATGDSGLHRWENGTWTWFGPRSENGPGAHRISGMAVDAVSGTLVAVSGDEGVWYIEEGSDRFLPLLMDGAPLEGAAGVATDPRGGLYLYTAQDIYRRAEDGVVTHILNIMDLDRYATQITDIAVSDSGVLLIATDQGIFGWKENRTVFDIRRSDGLGSIGVRSLAIDGAGRVWYTIPGAVGLITDLMPQNQIAVGEANTTGPGENTPEDEPDLEIKATQPPPPAEDVEPIPTTSESGTEEDLIGWLCSLLMTPAREVIPLPSFS